MSVTAASKTVRLEWWPLIALAPAVAALALALWGLGASHAYVVADSCTTGWQVPWGVPFAVIQSVGLMGGVVSYAVARSSNSKGTRSMALAGLIAGVAVWVAALVIQAAPYGWHC